MTIIQLSLILHYNNMFPSFSIKHRKHAHCLIRIQLFLITITICLFFFSKNLPLMYKHALFLPTT